MIIPDNLTFDKLLEIIRFFKMMGFPLFTKNGFKYFLPYIESEEIMTEAIHYYPQLLKYVSISIKNNREIVLEAVAKDGSLLQYASDELRDDKDVVCAAIGQNPAALEFASAVFHGDFNIVLNAVKYNGYLLQFASAQVRDNIVIVLEAINQNPAALEFASDRLRSDEEVVLAAIRESPIAIEFALGKAANDQDIADVAVSNDYKAYALLSLSMRSVMRVFITALLADNSDFITDNTSKAEILKYASESIKDDEYAVKNAIWCSPFSIEYASERLRDNEELVSSALCHDYFKDSGHNKRKEWLSEVSWEDPRKVLLRCASERVQKIIGPSL